MSKARYAASAIRGQPVGFVAVVESVGDLVAVIGVVRVPQLEGIRDEFRLLQLVKQGDFAFKLLETHGASVTSGHHTAKGINDLLADAPEVGL